MGVLGLWEILESVGHPVKVEGLEGKVLGVDANIWLYKFIRGFREKDGASNIESHKLGLFNRISKLLFYRIKPVFVFDGPAPVLKRRTLERRQNTRNKTLSKVQDAAMKALANQLKSQYPDKDIDHLRIKLPELRSNNLVAAEKLGEEDFNLFYLPPETDKKNNDSDDYDSYSDDELQQAIRDSTKVDVNSKDFESMPPEIKYEILQDIKAKRRRIRNIALPDDANSFSNLQLQRLKERRQIQEKIEKCEQEICKNYTGELADGRSVQAYRVQSNKDLRILYCNNSYDPKAFEKLKEEPHGVKTERAGEEGINKGADLKKTSDPVEISYIDLVDDSEAECYKLDSSRLTARTITIDSSIEEQKVASDFDTDDDDHGTFPEELEQIERDSPRVSSPLQISATPSPEVSCEVAEISSESETNSPPQPEVSRKDSQSPEIQSRSSQASSEPKGEKTAQTEDESCIIRLDGTIGTGSVPTSEYHSQTSSLTSSDDHPHQSELTKAADPPKPIESTQKQQGCSKRQDARPESSPPTISITECLPRNEETARLQTISPIGSQPTRTGSQSSSQLISQSEHVANAQRTTNKVTSKIIEDAKELLRLFGIPYIDAAGEAEAQCAKLEELNLTMGTITDDSDIWLFGAQNVYRYFFSDDKYVMQYKMPDIEYHIRMTRENLVCFAMMVGSDYTDGIMNVGPVTALEILSEFPGVGLDCLMRFTEWQRAALQDKTMLGDKKRKKLLKYHIPSEFPSRAVYEGYMNPMADSTDEKFTWGTPELDELREYARRNFGWDQKRTDEKLLPVMKRLNEKIQKTIDTFFFKTQANRNPEMFRSKRVNQALNKIAKRAALDTDVVNLSEDDEDS